MFQGFKKHLHCQELLVIISGYTEPQEARCVLATWPKAPPQCEDLNGDEKKKFEKKETKGEQSAHWLLGLRVSIFHRGCLLFPEAITLTARCWRDM